MAKRNKTNKELNGAELLRAVRGMPPCRVYLGRTAADKNFPGPLLIAHSSDELYSIALEDVLSQLEHGNGLSVIQVRENAQVLRVSIEYLEGSERLASELGAMEYRAPPPPPAPRPRDPRPATESDIEALQFMQPEARSIGSAASHYNKNCAGGDTSVYANNCAHFLSDAFIRAGYTELLPPHDCVQARCDTGAKRVIRARDMWCWLKQIANEHTRKLERNTGMWAVFQLNESQYWGGHVVIVDTDSNKYYGTGNRGGPICLNIPARSDKWNRYAG